MTTTPAAPPYFTTLMSPRVTLEREPLRLVSEDFGDIYFSVEDGLAESELVFINGNDVISRMKKAKGRFTITETGFGTGLNFLAVLRQWRMLGEKIGSDAVPRLHYIATEIAPLEAEMIREVLGGIPEIADDAVMMAEALPPRWPGRHRRHFCGGRVTLDLLYGDSLTMLARSSFQADAWFLDGFAPQKNPEMWQDDLFRVMAEKSADGATVASFTAAGDVRRGLEEAGFTVTRCEGFGRKRHRITGLIGGGDAADIAVRTKARVQANDKQCDGSGSHDEEVIIIGAGIAGASVAAGLRRSGITPLVIGQGDGPHDGASGNIAAVQSPRLTAEESFSSQLAMTCYGYARWVARIHEAGLAETAVIYGWNDREQKRQAKILAQGLPRDFVREGDAEAMSKATGIKAAASGLIFDHGGAVDPRIMTRGLMQGAKTLYGKTVTAMTALSGGGWQITLDDDNRMTTRKLVLAGGSGLAALTEGWGADARQYPPLPFQVTAGRVSHLPADKERGETTLKAAMSFGGYMAQTQDGTIAIGATFDKNINDKLDISQQVHEDNIALIPEALRGRLPDDVGVDLGADHQAWDGRVSYRIASKDRHPVAGDLGDGLYILTALGARGMVTGPLLGDYVASLMTDAPSPLDQGMASVVNPMRFCDDGM